jgi:MFS transporter, OFA family, oxalate/formate antiporter
MVMTKGSHSIVAACFLIQAVGIGTFVTYGVFFNSLSSELGWSRALISGASSVAFFLSGIFAVLVGRLSDQYGPRIFMGVAALFFGSGFMLMSRVYEVWQLYLFYGLIFGIGLSAIDVIALTTTARWFATSRGFMTGIVKVGTGAGQFSIPLLASILIGAYGWRNAYLFIGAMACILLLGASQLLRPYPKYLDGKHSQDVVQPILDDSDEKKSFSVKEALKTKQLWLLCGAYLLLVFCLIIVLVHIVPHATDIGLSHKSAAGILSTIGAVSMIGRFLSGVTIDRTSSKTIMVICFFILIAILLWLRIADSLWMLYLFGGVYGLAHGGFFTAISPIVVEVFGISAHGAIFGIVVFFGTLGGAIGPVVAGKMFDLSGNYNEVFTMITIASCVSFGLMLMLKPIVVRH